MPQIIVALTQSTQLEIGHRFWGGSTVIVDLLMPAIKYLIVKRITSEARRDRTTAFLRGMMADPLSSLMLTSGRNEPFALLHSSMGGGI